MKIRIAIVVIGLLMGLLARTAVEYFQRFREQHSFSAPAAASAPAIKTERK